MKQLILPFLLCWSATLLMGQTTPKVLIIGIDGCRPDALQAAATPNLDALIANATYSFDALTEAQTWSGVGWSGMLTGVWRDKHGVSDNSFNGSNYGNYPHFFNHLKSCNPNLEVASIVHWGPINSQIVDQVDYAQTVSTDLAVEQEAVTYLANNDPDVLFLHFDDVDYAGHGYGFNPTVNQYTSTISTIDAHVGGVIAAVENRPNYDTEEWLIIVSTDHGGNFSGHGGSSIEEREMFVIVSGDVVDNEQRSKVVTTTNVGAALAFNANDQYVNVPSSTNYQFGSSQDFTIECRVRINSVSGDPVILSDKNWASGFNPGYVLSFPFNSASWKVNLGDGSNRVDITGGEVVDGEWHHLAVSFDRSGMMKMYQDGSLVKTEEIAGIGNINSGLPLAIGQDGTHNYPDWFDGEIAEVRLWNTVVTEEVLGAYACGSVSSGHPDYGNLVGYWPLGDGSGTTIQDLSPNNNNGTLVGAAPNWLNNAGAITCQDYSNSLRIVDVAATALKYLCGEVDPAWDLDGVSVPINLSLPVNWTHFEAKQVDCKVALTWGTSMERNNGQFIVERSTDGRSFQPLGEVSGAGSTNQAQSYHFQDEAPFPVTYYRVKQVDVDGTAGYSRMVAASLVGCGTGNGDIKVSPNPAMDELRVRFTTPVAQAVTLTVINTEGKWIAERLITSVSGENIADLSLVDLSSGTYYLHLVGEKGLMGGVKFVKQ